LSYASVTIFAQATFATALPGTRHTHFFQRTYTTNDASQHTETDAYTCTNAAQARVLAKMSGLSR